MIKITKKQEKPTEDKYAAMALNFVSKLPAQTVYDPKRTNTRTTRTYTLLDKEIIFGYLKNPTTTTAAKGLVQASQYMYMSNGHYRRLIDYYVGLPLWQYVITALNFEPSKVSKESFRKQYFKTAQYIDMMNLAQEMRKATTVAARDGIFYGVIWKGKNSWFLQGIEPTWCVVTSISDGCLQFKVDMSQIKKENLDQYPPEFEVMYREYETTGDKYQEVPEEISFCLKADLTSLDTVVPPFASTFPALYTIAAIEDMQEVSEELKNYKLVWAYNEVDPKTKKPIVDYPLMLKYYNHISNAIGDYVGLVTTPFKLDTIDFEKNSSLSDTDSVSKAVDNFFNTAGTSSALFNAKTNTAGALKLAVKSDEAFITPIVMQCQRLVNRYLKMMPGTVKFQIRFLPTTIYNQDEQVKLYKEAATYGIGKSYYAAALGINQVDIAALDYIEDNMIDIDNILTPLKSTHTMSSTDAGRPQEDETNLTDSGAQTRDGGENDNK